MVHDPAAALIVDSKVVAAVEEERLIRQKHAKGKLPLKAIEYCLEAGGLKPSDIDVVAFPWSPQVYNRYKFQYFRRKFLASPDRAIKALSRAGKTWRGQQDIVNRVLDHFKIDRSKTKVVFVEHHLAHAASAFFF